MIKIIAIGELVLDIFFNGRQPFMAHTGGRIANAAAALASTELPVTFVGECTDDRTGHIVLHFLRSHGVLLDCVDCYPDGASRTAIIFDDDNTIVNYGTYPEKNRFNVAWPRINNDDIVVFGSLYAIDLPQRKRLFDLIRYAHDMKALIIYLPGCQHGLPLRVTKVMPYLLENLEVADLVIANYNDWKTFFPDNNNIDSIYHNRIEFYGGHYLHIGTDTLMAYTPSGNHSVAAKSTTTTLGAQAGILAGTIHSLIKQQIGKSSLASLSAEQWTHLLTDANEWASICHNDSDNCVPTDKATSFLIKEK